jgi:Spy/CpxP family protein refolding chaperone
MNTKLIALLGTTATLFMSTAWVNLAQANPLSTSSDQQMILAQQKKNRLNLTDAQKTQMRQIREATRGQIENVLTPEQRNTLRAAKEQRSQQRAQQQGQQRGQRGQYRQVWSSLNLSAEQQAQIKRIRDESRQRMQAVLTPEQQQQMQQMRQNRQNRRQEQAQ